MRITQPPIPKDPSKYKTIRYVEPEGLFTTQPPTTTTPPITNESGEIVTTTAKAYRSIPPGCKLCRFMPMYKEAVQATMTTTTTKRGMDQTKIYLF